MKENDKPKKNRLSAKRLVFVEEYCVDLNATRAAKAAGYSATKGCANVEGYRLLRNPAVRALVDAKLAKKGSIREITADSVLDKLQNVYIQATRDGKYTAAARAAELIGKHVGMFRDKLEIDFATSYAALVVGSEGKAPIEVEPGADDEGGDDA